MGLLFWKKKKEKSVCNSTPASEPETMTRKEMFDELMEASNGMGFFDYIHMSQVQYEEAKKYAKELGITCKVERKSQLMVSISESKFKDLSDDLANMKTFAIIFFDNKEQLKKFANYIDSMETPDYTKKSRILSCMLNGEKITL